MRRFSADYLERTREGLWADREPLTILHLRERDSILDVGCGTGEFTRVLADECSGSVVGVDRDGMLLAHLSEKEQGIKGDAHCLPFPDDSVDLVVCQALLVNLSNPAHVLREFSRIARESVAAIEPDNEAVVVDSTVDTESRLASEARRRYVAGVDTDVTLGSDLGDLFRTTGLSDVSVRRHDHETIVEPPYSDADLVAVRRKARANAIRDRRQEMSGTADDLDSLRTAWREMGRTVIEQVQAGEYKRREVVPFFVGVGDV